jgi:hypothetical protein
MSKMSSGRGGSRVLTPDTDLASKLFQRKLGRDGIQFSGGFKLLKKELCNIVECTVGIFACQDEFRDCCVRLPVDEFS